MRAFHVVVGLLLTPVAALVVFGMLSDPEPLRLPVKEVQSSSPPVAKPEPLASPAPSPVPKRRETVSEDELGRLFNEGVEILNIGREMGKVRSRAGGMERCMDLMHEHLPRAQALMSETETLPLEYFELDVAANHMTRCLTCVGDSATENCKLAAESMHSFKAEFGPKAKSRR